MKLTPFGGLFSIMEQFDSTLSSVIDSTLGQRCKSFGYQYSEIIRSLMSIYFCDGSCIEDVTTHLMNHLSLHPTLRTCSSDTDTAYCLKSHCGVRGCCGTEVGISVLIICKFSNKWTCTRKKEVEGLSCGFEGKV